MEQEKKKVFFKVLNFDNVAKKAKGVKKQPKKEVSESFTLKKIQHSLDKDILDISKVIPINIDKTFETQHNSISEFVGHFHPDLRHFIYQNEIYSVKAVPHTLTIITRNKFRITINVISKLVNNVKIQLKKDVIFEGESVAYFK